MLRFFKRAASRAVTQVIYRVIMAVVGLAAITYLSNHIKTLF
jgi:hypothetical protein